METRTCTASAPLMPAAWPVKKRKERPIRRRFPHSVDEPVAIGHYLNPLVGISSHPDREALLRDYLQEFIV